jgi:hypothetical protein
MEEETYVKQEIKKRFEWGTRYKREEELVKRSKERHIYQDKNTNKKKFIKNEYGKVKNKMEKAVKRKNDLIKDELRGFQWGFNEKDKNKVYSIEQVNSEEEILII